MYAICLYVGYRAKITISLLTDFYPYQHVKTQHPTQVLEVITSSFSGKLHRDVLSYENAFIRLVENARVIKRNHSDRSYPDRSAFLPDVISELAPLFKANHLGELLDRY